MIADRTDWCKSGSLCVYDRSPRAVLFVDGAPFLFNGQLVATYRPWSVKQQCKYGPQGMYAVSALRPCARPESAGVSGARVDALHPVAPP